MEKLGASYSCKKCGWDVADVFYKTEKIPPKDQLEIKLGVWHTVDYLLVICVRCKHTERKACLDAPEEEKHEETL